MKSSKNLVLAVAIVVLPMIVVFITAYSFYINGFFNMDYFLATDKLGHFGDFIGGFLGTFLTIIATVYVFKTYQSQKSELEEQRKLIQQQQFESTFFNMLNVHRDLKRTIEVIKYYPLKIILADMKQEMTQEKLVGLKSLEEINIYFRSYFYKITKRQIIFEEKNDSQKFAIKDFKFEDDLIEFGKIKVNSEEAVIKFVYEKIFEKFQDEISHYCRNVYTILKFIREKEELSVAIDKKEKFRIYSDIFQSQLNVNEQFLLFYNFIYFNTELKGIYSTISIVNHYEFLENLGKNNLLDEVRHNKKYFYNFDIK